MPATIFHDDPDRLQDANRWPVWDGYDAFYGRSDAAGDVVEAEVARAGMIGADITPDAVDMHVAGAGTLQIYAADVARLHVGGAEPQRQRACDVIGDQVARIL